MSARLWTVLGAVAMTSVLALSVGAKTSGPGVQVGKRVDNFMLADQSGVGHELQYYRNAKAIVLASHQIGDAASEKTAAALAKAKAAYGDKGVEFFLINSSLKDSRESIAKAAADLGVPVLDDELQLVGRSLGVMQTGEVFVVDPATWKVLYHGPVDKTLAAKKTNASLAGALDAVLAGKPVAVDTAQVKGTKLTFPDRGKEGSFEKISYATEVAPILADKCVTCHTSGGMAPFAMDRYETVKGFAPMIREALRTGRMPPFHSDGHGAKWSNDMSLSDAQKKTVVNWIEAGAPRGTGADPLPTAQKPVEDWPMGKPDLIVDVPAFDVPASGIVDYQDWSVASKLTEGKWLKATAWKAGAVPVVHHALAGWMPEVRADGRGFSWNVSMGGYGPGGEANTSPPDTGTYIPPGGSFTYQMHYTSVGRPMRDATQVGYYFYKETPKHILRQASITDFSIEIPAGASRHHETAYLEFPQDAEIYGTQPHCHSRCYATKLRIRYPDGTEKLLLNQPRYDFGWQREYHFDGLLQVPAGSKLIADYVFDNSAANPANPDPTKNVTFGEQTSEEMLFTFVRFRFKGESSDNRKDEWFQELQQNITVGALDDNMDGKLVAAEFRNDPRFKPLVGFIPMVDANKDGALDKAEMNNAMSIMRKMRQSGQAPAPKMDAGTAAMTGQGQ